VLGAGPLVAPAAETNLAASGNGWTAAAPREEISRCFAMTSAAARAGRGRWSSLRRAGRAHRLVDETFEIEGGQITSFTAWRQTDGVASPRRSGVVRILWRDAKGQPVKHR